MQQSTQQPDLPTTALPDTQTSPSTRFCTQAVLAALGQYVQHHDLLASLREQVHIAQKSIKYTPAQKLTSALVLLLMGATRMVEINTRLRCEQALLAAFGLDACAEQSVIQDTLDACDDTNVAQMQQVCDLLYRKHSGGYAHDYQAAWQVLDIDVSGRPCGRLAENACKGYFSGKRNQRGRQEGRVYASLYDEIVCQRLYAGNQVTLNAFVPLLDAAQQTLQLTPQQRARTIVRADAGAGAMDEVNACLQQGFAFHGKDYSDQRVRSLVDTVEQWYDDPRTPGRQVGLVSVQDPRYGRPLVRVMVRAQRKNGTWAQDLILSTLCAHDVLALTGQPSAQADNPAAVLLAYVYFYDARGGGVECGFRQDKQALGLCQRNKKRFAAQQVLDCLCVMAHNLLIWAREWLFAPREPLKRYGLKRLLRDVHQIAGQLTFDTPKHVCRIVLNAAHPFAPRLQPALTKLLAQEHTDVCLGEI